MLTGSPDTFAQMTASAQVQVADGAVAADVAAVYLDTTRDFLAASYRIDSIDVLWLPKPDAAAQQRRAALEAQYSQTVAPPTAEPSDAGWTVTVWMVADRTLVRHQLEVGADGAVTDRSDVVETDLPVPYSR
ncbi:MAG: hypothetical protein FWE61_08490 [Micrococcales bacterium]|nr:hypothetical protein [Micrococcales bacterium]